MPNDSSVCSKKAQVPTVTVTNSADAVDFSHQKKKKQTYWVESTSQPFTISITLPDDAVVYLLTSFVTLFPSSVNLGP